MTHRPASLLPSLGGWVLLCSTGPWVAGQATTPRHPVLPHDVDGGNPAAYEDAVTLVMGMTEERLLSLVPDKPFTAYCECPNCYGGVEGNHIFAWSIERSGEMTCKHCGTVYPNDAYPEDAVLSGENGLGETVTFNYHYDAERKIPSFLTGNLRRWQRNWVMSQCVALGKAYFASGKEQYADRVVLILDRLAQLYPHYPIMRNLCRRFTFRESQQPPFPWDSGRWGYFHNEIPKTAVAAYDLVYHSKAFERLSGQRGYDVRATLETDLLKPTFDAVSLQTHHMSNIIGYDVAGAAMLGRVVHEPSYVHWAFRWMKKVVNEGCFYDGMWHESPSYHYMTVGGLKAAFTWVQGYSDPPGYVDEVDGTRFVDLDPEASVPFLAKMMRAPEVLDFPPGWSTPVHDTHAQQKRSEPRDRTVSTIAPGFGHASLGRGAGTDQMQAQLHFSGSHGHAHLDNLNLTLWAKEREMLPDLGYTWTQMRYWCTCTLGHNLVVVDRTDQSSGTTDGDLLSFFPDTGGVAVVEADGRRGYGNISGLDVYRRLLVMVPVSDADAYVVDVFRVHGGTVHDWALHGDAFNDMTAASSIPLAGARATMLEPGEEWVEPTIEGAKFNPYGMLRDMQRGTTDDHVRFDLSYVDAPGKGVRVHMLAGGPAEVWLGRAPSVRRMGYGTSGDMRKAYDYWMPQLLVRRHAQSPSTSVFAAVHEPYDGERFVSSVERVPLTPPDPSAVAVRVRHGETVDTIISTLDREPTPERRTPDGVRLQGRLGVIRQVAGETTGMWLFEGSKLASGGATVTGMPRYTGEIAAGQRKADGDAIDAFVTQADIPEGNGLRGSWIIVTHANGMTHGYEIDHVSRGEGGTVLVLTDDHGLRIEGSTTTEVYFPLRTSQGPNTFVIPVAAVMTITP